MEKSTDQLRQELEVTQGNVKKNVIKSDFNGRVAHPNDNFYYWSGYDAALNFVLGKLK